VFAGEEMTNRWRRRAALRGIASASLSLFLFPVHASDTPQYEYDLQGRVIRVQFQDGSAVVYAYDTAGNHTQVSRTALPTSNTFTATIAVTGCELVNLLTPANTAGYDGTKDANVTCVLDTEPSPFEIGSAPHRSIVNKHSNFL